MRFFALVSIVALARAAAVPVAQVDKVGHLTHGDVQVNLLSGCNSVPANPVSNIGALFTKVEVNAGYSCTLYAGANCKGVVALKVTGPIPTAEYVSLRIVSSSCTKSSKKAELSI